MGAVVQMLPYQYFQESCTDTKTQEKFHKITFRECSDGTGTELIIQHQSTPTPPHHPYTSILCISKHPELHCPTYFSSIEEHMGSPALL